MAGLVNGDGSTEVQVAPPIVSELTDYDKAILSKAGLDDETIEGLQVVELTALGGGVQVGLHAAPEGVLATLAIQVAIPPQCIGKDHQPSRLMMGTNNQRYAVEWLRDSLGFTAAPVMRIIVAKGSVTGIRREIIEAGLSGEIETEAETEEG